MKFPFQQATWLNFIGQERRPLQHGSGTDWQRVTTHLNAINPCGLLWGGSRLNWWTKQALGFVAKGDMLLGGRLVISPPPPIIWTGRQKFRWGDLRLSRVDPEATRHSMRVSAWNSKQTRCLVGNFFVWSLGLNATHGLRWPHGGHAERRGFFHLATAAKASGSFMRFRLAVYNGFQARVWVIPDPTNPHFWTIKGLALDHVKGSNFSSFLVCFRGAGLVVLLL